MHVAFHPEYPLVCFVLLYLWVWYSNNVITALFLSVIEDGYVEQSEKEMYDWLEKDISIKNDIDRVWQAEKSIGHDEE
jgi:hypothetical protein